MSLSPLVRNYGRVKPPLGWPLCPSHPLSRGLVGCWIANEGAGGLLFDVCRKAGDATLTSGASRGASPFGPAVSLNGTSGRATVPDAPANSLTGAMSVVVGFVPLSVTGTHTLFAKWDTTRAGGDRFSWILFCSGAGLDWRCSPDGSSVANSAAVASGLAAGVPSVAAGVYDGAALRLYRNGLQAASTAYASGVKDTGAALEFGSNDGGSGWFSGQVAFWYLYGRALSAAEVMQLYLTPYAMFAQPAPWRWAQAGLYNIFDSRVFGSPVFAGSGGDGLVL